MIAPLEAERPGRVFAVLRDARWVTRDRLLFAGVVFFLAALALLAVHVVSHTKKGFTNEEGGPIACDFLNYYSAALLAAEGRAPLVYDHQRFHAFEEAITGPVTGKSGDPWIGVMIYSYPPTTILMTLPLALLPFGAALFVWSFGGAAICAGVLRHLVGWRPALLAVVGAPAAFFNLQSGQNGFFTAALFAGGLTVLERRPIVAGICIGSLVYKPQMAVLLPFVLAADARWRTIASATATAGVLLLASLALCGAGGWHGWFDQMAVQRYLLEVDKTLWDRMLTVYGAAGELKVAARYAYAAQVISTVAAIGTCIAIWRSSAPAEAKYASVAIGAFLATPYALDYDAVLLVFAAVWMWRAGTAGGFLSWERIAIVALLLLPVPLVLLTRVWDVPIGAPVLWAILLLLVRRAVVSPAVAVHAAGRSGAAMAGDGTRL